MSEHIQVRDLIEKLQRIEDQSSTIYLGVKDHEPGVPVLSVDKTGPRQYRIATEELPESEEMLEGELKKGYVKGCEDSKEAITKLIEEYET